jgi:hypothetical protein
VAKAAARIATLPHRVLAYRGVEGLPVIVPVQIAGHDGAGLHLVVATGLLPRAAAVRACLPTPTGRNWSG